MRETVPKDIHALIAEDLERSGLTTQDINVRPAGGPEINACGVKSFNPNDPVGYVIEYNGYDGNKTPFYRLRIFNPLPGRAKYLQPPQSAVYVYFPKGFRNKLAQLEKGLIPPCVIITEGEKKAAKLDKEGYLAIGLGGVYSWKSRTLVIPETVTISRDLAKHQVLIKIPSSGNSDSMDSMEATMQSAWATGLQEIIHLITSKDLSIIIMFDTDFPEKPQVQQAAATLAFELRSAGIPVNKIRQIRLPAVDHKVAVDDFLVDEGPEALKALVDSTLAMRTAFPAHPNMREYVNSRLSRQLRRDQIKDLATAVLADLDSRGTRLKDINTSEPYYFSAQDKTLMPVGLLKQEPLHETTFGQYLFRNYDISQADTKLIPWLATMFTGEDPVYNVQPRSTITMLPDGNIAFQISDGQYVLITADAKKPFTVCDNGTNGIMFKGGQTEPTDVAKLQSQLQKQLKEPIKPWWWAALKEFKFQRDSDRKLATILFYCSPWLLRWRGTQLPMELMIGEPGSGKSSMYMLRSQIITGRATLRNQPSDVRDWYSSITSCDGLHVTDNVHFVSKEVKQRISDEICRIITEPDPTIEMRKLYTTKENLRVPIRSVFAFTAIQQPFTNADIIQRSAIFELNAVGGNHDSNWTQRHMENNGGREAWLAHHLVVVHKFLMEAAKSWNTEYRSKHRLVNYEQTLTLMGSILGIGEGDEVRNEFIRSVEEQVSEYDWTMEGLREFAAEVHPQMAKDPNKMVTCAAISEWALMNEDFKDNATLNAPRRLAKYFKSHITMIEKVAGYYEAGSVSNRVAYRVKFCPNVKRS